MKSALEGIFHQLSSVCHHDISVFSYGFLERSLEKRMAALGYASMAQYRDFLVDNCDEASVFFRSLNINHSEFFRNLCVFAILEQQIFPKLLKQKEAAGQKLIRIWSAGCAAGQEAYSVAMILEKLIADTGSNVSFRIFATDVSSAELARAKMGVYPLTAVENVPLKYYRRYFTGQKESCTVNEDLKPCVDFSLHDLLDPDARAPVASIFGDFDLILCCNLLFYYNDDIQMEIIRKLQQVLSQQGTLVTGEVEQDVVQKSGMFCEIVPQLPVYGSRERIPPW